MTTGNICEVPMDRIDWDDDFFCFGRRDRAEELKTSIKRFGLVEKPVLVERSNRFQIFRGFNRLHVLRESVDSVSAVIINKAAPEMFTGEVGSKLFHDRIGPAGRIRVCEILRDYFSFNSEHILKFGLNNLSVPENFLPGGRLYDSYNKLPPPLKEYFDRRDIPFRLIKDFIGLSEISRKRVADLVLQWDIGKNNFKKTLDLLSDIEQGEDQVEIWHDAEKGETSVPVNFEEFYSFLYRIRYPSYSGMVKERDRILRDLGQAGVKIAVPEYFERSEITVAVRVKKNEGKEDLLNKVRGLDGELLEELLELI